MGFLDSILGRSRPPRPNLDNLFAIPSAAVTLEASLGVVPTGSGSVCFRAPEGKAFGEVQADIQQLLDLDQGPSVRAEVDGYGYTWLTVSAADVATTVTDLHAVNSSLQDAGFGPQLLCSLVGFRRGEQAFGLIYLYKRGTFYPFAPKAEPQRDTVLELQLRDLLGSDLPIEPDTASWFPVWGAPGL